MSDQLVSPTTDLSTGEAVAHIRVALADDHRSMRDGMASAFREVGVDVVVEVGDGDELVERALATRPDVILTDLSMPRCNGIEATRRIRLLWPEARIVLLTMHDDTESVRTAVLAGACGFLGKDLSFEEILDVVRRVAAGETVLSTNIAAQMLEVIGTHRSTDGDLLSERQIEILRLVADGRNTTQIARQLQISPKTVANHLAAVYRRLDAQNLTQAILRAIRLGIINLG